MNILPILKTDALGLPHGLQWMESILRYMVANEITKTKQIPYSQIVKEICPGQTNRSVRVFLNGISNERKDGKTIRSNDIFHVICKRRLNEPSYNSILGSDTISNAKLDYINHILRTKKSLLTGQMKENEK